MGRIIFYTGLVIAAFFLIFVFIFWWQIRTPLDSSGEILIFKVEKGDSAKTVAVNLKKSELIKSSFVFRLYVFLSLGQYSLKPGEYEISPKMPIRDIADTMVLGGVNEVLLTIPEGFSLKQIEDRLVAAKLAKPGEIVSLREIPHRGINSQFTENIPPILSGKPKYASLEGYLFPDTYRFFKDASLSDIVSKMVANLDSKITPNLKTAMADSGRNTYEILTVASLIEKEVKSDADMEVVSGILWKRLRAGIPLQVDATLIYITGRRDIYESDKKINSPYNTYFYRGLPKGPIASPGLSAIKAAVFPKTSPYLYYLSAKDGKTIFSITLDEHNRNKAIYLK
ncbi:MAG: endolytic transglycosylase MltG [Parcubacteria group bacterium]|nr:endolytic transglycosylase MltG [Parcubacteria group bacterium]